MTIQLMENTAKGDVRVKNGLSRRIDIAPNPYMTRKTLIYTIVWTLLMDGAGNQVTYPKYTADGNLEMLMPFKPSAIKFEPSGNGYYIEHGNERYKPDEVLHFVINPDPENPWQGTGYRAVLSDVLKGLKQAITTRKALMESPAPSIIVKVDGLSSDFASPEGRKELSSEYLESSETGKPWFIPAEAFAVEQVKPLSMTDLAISENITIDKRTAAGIYGVPPFLVGVGTYNKEEFNNFVSTKIMPFSKVIEQELTRKLLYSESLYWKFNPRSLYNYSIEEIVNAGSSMVDRMAMRRNEWRDWIGLPPDEDMEELLALENYIPADKLGEQKKLMG